MSEAIQIAPARTRAGAKTSARVGQPEGAPSVGQYGRAPRVDPIEPEGGPGRSSPDLRAMGELPLSGSIPSGAMGQSCGAPSAGQFSGALASDPPARRKRATKSSEVGQVTVAPSAGPSGRAPSDDAMQITLDILRDRQARRMFCMRAELSQVQTIESFLARRLGWVPEKGAKGKELFKRVAAFRVAVEDNKVTSDAALERYRGMVEMAATARHPWEKERMVQEKHLRAAAETLPIWAWAKSVRGLGSLAVGVIAAEAGSLSSYPTHSHLWKRLGLAVIDGERQQCKSGTEAALAHGFSPQRRAQVWALVDDMLLRAQWCGADSAWRNAISAHPEAHAAALARCATEKVPFAKAKADMLAEVGMPFGVTAQAHPRGRYGEFYGRRRAHTADRIEATAHLPHKDPGKWTPPRCKNDAIRYMTKHLIKDMWRQWRWAEAGGVRFVP